MGEAILSRTRGGELIAVPIGGSTITIDATKINATLTDYPVMVKLTSANFDFSKSRSDGFDIRFFSGETQLAHEIEQYDNMNQFAIFHVKVPSISSTVNTQFFMKHGKLSLNQNTSNKTAVWASHFVMVQHMGSSFLDSTSNGNNGTASGTGLNESAVYGRSTTFTNSAFINVPDSNSLDVTSQITLMAFGYYTNTDNKTFIEKSSDNTNYQFQVGAGVTGGMEFRVSSGTGARPATNYSGSEFRVYHGTNNNASQALYVNGTSVATATLANPVANTSPLKIGARSSTVGFTGLIKEIRVSNIPLSAAWIKADDHNLRLNDLITIGG